MIKKGRENQRQKWDEINCLLGDIINVPVLHKFHSI